MKFLMLIVFLFTFLISFLIFTHIFNEVIQQHNLSCEREIVNFEENIVGKYYI